MYCKIKYLLLVAGFALAIRPAAAQTAPSHHFATSQIACSNYFSPQRYRHVMRLIGARGGMQVSLFTPGDVLYLNHAGDFHRGDAIRLMRVASVGQEAEQFPGQFGILSRMGAFFQTVGRAKILRINRRGIALARMTFACQPAQVGDFALAWRANPGPIRPRLTRAAWRAPVRGRAQLVAMGRDMAGILGANDEIYLTGGAAAGARIGQVWTLFRRRDSPSNWQFKTESEGMAQSSTHPEPGLNVGALRAIPEPADVLGSAVIIRVEPRSATAIIVTSRAPILAGDEAVAAAR